MMPCEKIISGVISEIEKKEIPLYQAIPIKDFTTTFAREIFAASNLLKDEGVKDFKVKTENGYTTIQTFNIASTLTFLKIHNGHLKIDEFLHELHYERDGSFQFGYLISSKLSYSLRISDDIELVPYREAEKYLSAVNKHEIDDFFNRTSPEFRSAKGDLAVLLITIPIFQMVFAGETKEGDMNYHPAMLASKKLRLVQEIISLVSSRAIKILVSWGSYSDARLDYLLGLTPHKNKDYYSESGISFFIHCMADTEWEKLKDFFDLILKIEHSKELNVALDRVYSSMGNEDFMGKVLDLAIAMEVMCVSGRGDNTYKVSTHISWLCSEDRDQRLKVMKCIKDFYSLRSSIVHEGIYSKSAVKSYGGEVQLYEIVLMYVKIALIKLLEFGTKPNWNEVSANGGLLVHPHNE